MVWVVRVVRGRGGHNVIFDILEPPALIFFLHQLGILSLVFVSVFVRKNLFTFDHSYDNFVNGRLVMVRWVV